MDRRERADTRPHNPYIGPGREQRRRQLKQAADFGVQESNLRLAEVQEFRVKYGTVLADLALTYTESTRRGGYTHLMGDMVTTEEIRSFFAKTLIGAIESQPLETRAYWFENFLIDLERITASR